MKKVMYHSLILFVLLFFSMATIIPVCTQAQPLPQWLSTPWGINSGFGYPLGYGIDVFSYYNLAASFSPLVPFSPYPISPYNPYTSYPNYSLTFTPPSPIVRNPAATITLILPTGTVTPAAAPVAPAPVISTTNLFLGLLLTIGEESGLFVTNPALFWNIVGILY